MASEHDPAALWRRYREHLCISEPIGLTLDVSRMRFDEGFLQRMEPAMQRAYEAMDELEAGAIANPDENRRVGHYWLRDPGRAPDEATAGAVRETLDRIRRFAADVHEGRIRPPRAERFTDVLVIGIGGSALGPQLVADALGEPDRDPLTPHFLDNTDPDGIERALRVLRDRLESILVIVISKSGGTPETRNGMLLMRAAFEKDHLDFAPQAVAITGEGSKLDQLAEEEGWLLRLPMWDWVGGRTSETGPVGLLPAALQGVDIDQLLAGAAACDRITRAHDTPNNPAALLALMWHHATNGRGDKDMVILPYKDRLLLMSRYLQQLVMESLGKCRDLDDNPVERGITVYGNKGSTDQHAYIQQLREGVNNFFVTFIRVLEAGGAPEHREIDPGVTAGDYLQGFLLGTREALHANDRESMTITVRRVDAFTVGALIALFERAVGFYASLVNINAYHQPGVEAGKQAAASVLELQKRALETLQSAGEPMTADQLAGVLGEPEEAEKIHHLLEHLAANERIAVEGGSGLDARYGSR